MTPEGGQGATTSYHARRAVLAKLLPEGAVKLGSVGIEVLNPLPSSLPFALSGRCPLSLEAFSLAPFASDVTEYFWADARALLYPPDRVPSFYSAAGIPDTRHSPNVFSVTPDG